LLGGRYDNHEVGFIGPANESLHSVDGGMIAVTDRSHPSATWVGTGIGVGARKAAFPFSAPTADTALALEIIARIPASV